MRRQAPKVGIISDSDAGWAVKDNKAVWGYKVNILADADHELPLTVNVTAGNAADIHGAKLLLSQLRSTLGASKPERVICDAAYCSKGLRTLIKQEYGAEPIIDPNASHKEAVASVQKTPEWKRIFSKRNAIERVNSRLKIHGVLNSVRVRGLRKVTVHVMLSIIVSQVRALVTRSRALVERVSRPWRRQERYLL
jgi:IS5 family transposase